MSVEHATARRNKCQSGLFRKHRNIHYFHWLGEDFSPIHPLAQELLDSLLSSQLSKKPVFHYLEDETRGLRVFLARLGPVQMFAFWLRPIWRKSRMYRRILKRGHGAGSPSRQYFTTSQHIIAGCNHIDCISWAVTVGDYVRSHEEHYHPKMWPFTGIYSISTKALVKKQ